MDWDLIDAVRVSTMGRTASRWLGWCKGGPRPEGLSMVQTFDASSDDVCSPNDSSRLFSESSDSGCAANSKRFTDPLAIAGGRVKSERADTLL